MNIASLSMAQRSAGEWLSSLPTIILLLLTIFLASGEVIHSQLLKIGESTWEGYFKLRTAGLVGAPTCNSDPNIEQEIQKAITEKKARMAADPLAGILGSEVNEGAIRQSLESSRSICRNKWSATTGWFKRTPLLE